MNNLYVFPQRVAAFKFFPFGHGNFIVGVVLLPRQSTVGLTFIQSRCQDLGRNFFRVVVDWNVESCF